jgi:biotin transport system substrate-specific component
MAHTRALANRVIPGEGLAWEILRIVAANLLLVLCARVAIPLPWTPVPITGQTFGVMLVAVLLGSHRAAITLVLYLLEGLAGLPVFQPFGLPGAARLAGPTAGYLMAYPFAAYVMGWMTEARSDGENSYSVARLVSGLLAGEGIIFAAGCAWLAFVSAMSWTQALTAGALPFLPGEIVKVLAVIGAAKALSRIRPGPQSNE